MRKVALGIVMLLAACTKQGETYRCEGLRDDSAQTFEASSEVNRFSGELVALHAHDGNGFAVTIDPKNSRDYFCRPASEPSLPSEEAIPADGATAPPNS